MTQLALGFFAAHNDGGSDYCAAPSHRRAAIEIACSTPIQAGAHARAGGGLTPDRTHSSHTYAHTVHVALPPTSHTPVLARTRVRARPARARPTEARLSTSRTCHDRSPPWAGAKFSMASPRREEPLQRVRLDSRQRGRHGGHAVSCCRLRSRRVRPKRQCCHVAPASCLLCRSAPRIYVSSYSAPLPCLLLSVHAPTLPKSRVALRSIPVETTQK